MLYRSYLWFGLVAAALPALARNVGTRKLFAGIALAAVCFVPASWNRLVTFSDPVLLWSDAVALLRPDPYPPGADRVYYNRGNAFLMQRRTPQALEDYIKVVQLNPRNQGALNNIGYVHYHDGRYLEAVRYYQQAVNIDPHTRRPHFGLGMSYRALGQEQAARDHFRRSCELGFRPACLKYGETVNP